MKKKTDYFSKAELKNIILNRSSCQLIKFPAPGAESFFQISSKTKVHYSHKPVPKRVNEFSVTITTQFTGYEKNKKSEDILEKNKIFEINCDISGYFTLTQGPEELEKLQNVASVFASQISPYIKEYIDNLLLKMDLTRRGARFPFLSFEMASEKPSKTPRKKRAS